MPSLPTQAQYSLILRVRLSNRPGMLGRVASAIGQAGAQIGTIDLVQLADGYAVRDITVETGGETHGDESSAPSTASTARRSSTPPTARS